MKPIRWITALAVTTLIVSSTATAQFGIGAGVAAMGSNVLQAGNGLITLAGKDSVTYADISSGIGFYGLAGFKYGYGGAFRLNLDVSYLFFPAQEITLNNASAQDTSATFDVGATLIPICLGGELVLPTDYFRPYLGAQLSYTIFDRTLTYVRGSRVLDNAEVHNQWEGHNEWGMSIKGGIEFGLRTVTFDVGARYNMANLFTKGDNENAANYLQVGVALYLGDLLRKDTSSTTR
jgi:outer membrane protein W